jgi:Na+/phosphate symporter
MMPLKLRKFALTVHVTSSVGLLGSIAAFLALAITGLRTQDTLMLRGAYLAMELIARDIVIPLAFASLLTGLVQSLGTPWGLFRHYWVLVKLLLTVFATVVLLVKMELIGYAARLAAAATLSRADLRAAGTQLAVHAMGGLLVLLVPAVLSVYKPPGLTAYGRRKLQEHRDAVAVDDAAISAAIPMNARNIKQNSR